MRKYIEDRSIPEPMTCCWIWLASLGSHGYGKGDRRQPVGELLIVGSRR